MKKLFVPFLDHVYYHSSTEALSNAIAAVTPTELGEVSWSTFPYKPEVHFRLAHTKDSLLLSYVVCEQHVKATYRNTNDPVYKDSCVEFFLSFDGRHYYNLEFNCAGTGLIGYGDADREKRRRLSNRTVETVRTVSHIHAARDQEMGVTWELLLNIPFSIFEAHSISSFSGMQCTGNFYKCGDELPVPHYVSWNRIDHPVPNFHLPQFFGALWFGN